jgi:hypothetical protein
MEDPFPGGEPGGDATPPDRRDYRAAKSARSQAAKDETSRPTVEAEGRTDQVETGEVGLEDVGDLHSVTSKLNIIPLSWCSAMWQ